MRRHKAHDGTQISLGPSNINSCNPFSDVLGQIWGTAQSPPPCPARVSNLDEFKSCGLQLHRCLRRSSVNQDKGFPASHAPWAPVMVACVDNLQRSLGVCRVISFDPPAPITHGFSSYLNQTQIGLAFREAQQGSYLLIKASLLPFSLSPPPQILLFLQDTSKEKPTWPSQRIR